MIMPLPVWNMAYSTSRRGRRHRCNGCNKVVGEGDAVVMARVSDKTTRAMHEVCAARPMGGSTFTGLEFLTAWGMEHLAKVGYGEARSFVDSAPIFQTRRADERTCEVTSLPSNEDRLGGVA